MPKPVIPTFSIWFPQINEHHPSRGRPVEAGQQAEERALAAPRRTGQRQEGSGLQLERDISEDGDLAPARDVGLGERLTAQDESEESCQHYLQTEKTGKDHQS